MVAIGGAIGAILRYIVTIGSHALLGHGFPYGTLLVNVIGSFVLGILSVLFIQRLHETSVLRAMLLIGLLGAFTTFSTFSFETIYLAEQGQFIKAGLNTILNVGLCLLAVYAGRRLLLG